MSKELFYQILNEELHRLDAASSSKRHEKVIEGFNKGRAIINGAEYLVFNSNDYLGLRFHPDLHKAEIHAAKKFGAGPGSVRFISGTLQPHTDLESVLTEFHGREDAMVFSSAFAANNAVLFSLIKPQSGGSLLDPSVLVVSDELNHRSIIDGIRLGNLSSDQKKIYKHLDYENLREVITAAAGFVKRVIVITDGVFSMLGEVADLKKLQDVVNKCESLFEQGILVIVDDSHGVGVLGKSGRGTEEVCNIHADVLVGTLGKAFGADGGYVVGKRELIHYLRETAAPYIYSNSISASTAAAAQAAVNIAGSEEGSGLRNSLMELITYFQSELAHTQYSLAVSSNHPIQPILIGDTQKSRAKCNELFESKILVTGINYPVVSQGRDEIRVQLSALHSEDDISELLTRLSRTQ